MRRTLTKPLNSAVETRILDLCSNFQNHNTTDFLKKKKYSYEEKPSSYVFAELVSKYVLLSD